MRKLASSLMVSVLFTAFFGGCNQSPAPIATPSSPVPESKYRLFVEPAGAAGVKEMRGSAQDDQEVTVVGRVGGDAKPWVEGIAVFQIVDLALKPCEEGCETPWDYCCDLDKLPEHKATVKFVDAQGQPERTDARTRLGIKELQTVVVHGRAKRDEAGNLTVLADGLFVRP